MADVPYLHGFTPGEQQRLIEQSLFLEPWVYEGLELAKIGHLLEIGSGVGAQTAILLKKFPNLKITCIDHSEFQLQAAEKFLGGFPEFSGRYTLKHMKGEKLDFPDNSFDGIYFCWVLEHVTQPEDVVRESHRVLQSGGRIFASEVFNSTFYTFPEKLYIKQFWEQYNQYQKSAGGDPDMGAKLGNVFTNGGFKEIKTQTRPFFADHRDEKQKKEIISYWKRLLMSAADNLLQAGMADENTIEMVQLEMDSLAQSPEGVFYCSFVRAIGRKL
jgi:ubiquinone/menaquinone biosynthesis C-methylase UbiE